MELSEMVPFLMWLLGAEDVDVFYGLWDHGVAGKSSNWREFYNQGLGIKRGIIKDKMIP
jgi:hypothetical protein